MDKEQILKLIKTLNPDVMEEDARLVINLGGVIDEVVNSCITMTCAATCILPLRNQVRRVVLGSCREEFLDIHPIYELANDPDQWFSAIAFWVRDKIQDEFKDAIKKHGTGVVR